MRSHDIAPTICVILLVCCAYAVNLQPSHLADQHLQDIAEAELGYKCSGAESLQKCKTVHSSVDQSDRLSWAVTRRSMLPNVVGGAFDWFPEWKGTLFVGQSVQFAGHCFSGLSVNLQSESAPQLNVSFSAIDPAHDACDEILLIANQEQFYVKLISKPGDYTWLFDDVRPEEAQDIAANGMQIFIVQAGILGEIFDLVDTLLLFKGPWTEPAALEFLQTHMNITYTRRTAPALNIPDDLIPDGTYFATQKFDGSEVMIQYGTGSYSGHSTVAIRVNGTLHVCESNGKNSPDYWPPPYGVTCHTYTEWISLATAAGYSVTLMPLAPELQALWDNDKAVAWMQTVLGLPYGFHNFLWGFVDTLTQNFPPPLSPQFFTVAFSILDRVFPTTAQSIYLDALNMRLQTSCTNMTCIMAAVLARNVTLMDVLIEPEQDAWVYPDGKSMVCDVFVLELYKAAGVFGDVVFQATEFTPRDLYTMAIFDADYKSTLISKGYACGALPEQVCQIMGHYETQFPMWTTIVPYDNMCERCAAPWPDYTRSPANC
eukprot:TRINITY_DN9267_c0_g1_i1.p1 TRINITY_DN9267_c0_g1~~TRINITY_DN9267_c0_g1_i1.p1  ORF type:complete len:543 (-),score=108.11 TRINITY_DN9267_c0_g1_i1:1052-2680(-)